MPELITMTGSPHVDANTSQARGAEIQTSRPAPAPSSGKPQRLEAYPGPEWHKRAAKATASLRRGRRRTGMRLGGGWGGNHDPWLSIHPYYRRGITLSTALAWPALTRMMGLPVCDLDETARGLAGLAAGNWAECPSRLSLVYRSRRRTASRWRQPPGPDPLARPLSLA